jgi:hypothetical protein
MSRPQIRDEIYENQRIVLDGVSWWACTFRGCQLVIEASGDFRLEQCTFSNCKLVLEGKAAIIAQQNPLTKQLQAKAQALLSVL